MTSLAPTITVTVTVTCPGPGPAAPSESASRESPASRALRHGRLQVESRQISYRGVPLKRSDGRARAQWQNPCDKKRLLSLLVIGPGPGAVTAGPGIETTITMVNAHDTVTVAQGFNCDNSEAHNSDALPPHLFPRSVRGMPPAPGS